MATIKSITATTYNNQPDGGYKVVITDGTKEVSGDIGKNDKKSDKGLQAGDEVTYSENPWTSKQGKVVNFLTVNRASSPNKGTNQSSSPQPNNSGVVNVDDYRVDAMTIAFKETMEAYRAEKLKWEEVKPKFKECAEFLYSEIDAIFKK